MDDAIAALLDVLEQSRLEYVVIGAHAVNAWLGPRFTADVDVTSRRDRRASNDSRTSSGSAAIA